MADPVPEVPSTTPEGTEPASVPAVAPLEVAPAHEPTLDPSLLETFDKAQAAKVETTPEPVAEKPVEAAPKEAPKPDVEVAPEPPKPEPVVDETPWDASTLKLPETLKVDEPMMGKFGEILTSKDLSRADRAQQLVDLHAQAMNSYAENVRADQFRVFNETRGAWRKEAAADPEIGGATHMTSMAAIARVRDMFIPEKEREAFNQFATLTGAGDHPVFLRMLHRIAQVVDEPAVPPSGGKPSVQKMGRKSGVLYDHPTSTRAS